MHRQCLFWNGKRIDMGQLEIEHVGEDETFHDERMKKTVIESISTLPQ